MIDNLKINISWSKLEAPSLEQLYYYRTIPRKRPWVLKPSKLYKVGWALTRVGGRLSSDETVDR